MGACWFGILHDGAPLTQLGCDAGSLRTGCAGFLQLLRLTGAVRPMLSSFATGSACVLAASTQFDYLPVGIRELHPGDSESTRPPAKTWPLLKGSCALDPPANCRNLLWLLSRALFDDVLASCGRGWPERVRQGLLRREGHRLGGGAGCRPPPAGRGRVRCLAGCGFWSQGPAAGST